MAGFFKCCLQALQSPGKLRGRSQSRSAIAKVSNCEGSANVHLKARGALDGAALCVCDWPRWQGKEPPFGHGGGEVGSCESGQALPGCQGFPCQILSESVAMREDCQAWWPNSVRVFQKSGAPISTGLMIRTPTKTTPSLHKQPSHAGLAAQDAAYSGVSSFGFGGTNAHAEARTVLSDRF